jgi:predicted MPP superfamily phosphohydrolase
MNRKLTRRGFLKQIVSFSITGLLTTTGGYMYARYIEPKQLIIEYHKITHPLIPKGFNGTKIIQFSDTHIGYHYQLHQLNDLIMKINEQSPDIVIFSGDLIDNPNKYTHSKDIIPIMKKITAPLGKLAIFGNHDHGGYGTNIYRHIIQQADFILLQNQIYSIKLLDNSQIALAGLDDCLLGKPSFNTLLSKRFDSIYTILLAHEPDIAEKASQYNYHLQLSGHTHGGQIKIPFLGPLYTPPLGKKFVEGFYEVGPNKMKLYVSRGLGTTRIPLRFLSKPELTIFTLSSTEI